MGSLVLDRLGRAADFQLTARQAQLGAAVIALTLAAVAAAQMAMATGLITPAGAPVGGDFSVFRTAAMAAAAGDAAAIYDPAAFHEWLARVAPGGGAANLTWQYPPTYFFIIGFLAAPSYWLGYALWSGGGLALFAASARTAGLRGAPWLVMLAAPAVFQALITGQNGFLTASLLLGATLLPDKRPLVAGACAALLTVKPQLGLLIPVAYAAAGCWRAFGVAAAGALFLGLASIAAFGLDAWTAFAASILNAGGAIASGVMPLYKMPTVYAAFTLAGASAAVALAASLIAAAAAVWATWTIWRRGDSPALKAAIVCAGAFLVAPYAYYYELVILAAPLALIAAEAVRDGWRRHDHLMLAALFLLPMMLPGAPIRSGVSPAILVTLLAFVFILRRMRPAP